MSANCSSCCAACGASPADLCGCCEGTRPQTPHPVNNPPGESALAYRAGTHAQFLATMKAALSGHALSPEQRPLAGLRARDTRDLTLALLDATAAVGDILTFYQERIANEGYLRTATERRSIVELARLVGYALKPGVAASTYLAFTIDDNTREEVVIAAGSKAQTVPGPGESPQTFETSEPLRARSAWNKLRPRQRRPFSVEDINRADGAELTVLLQGISTGLKVGDPLLLQYGEQTPVVHAIRELSTDPAPDKNWTKVVLTSWPPREERPNPIELLVREAPSGKTADRVKRALQKVAAARSKTPEQAHALVHDEALPALDEAFERLHGLPATKLRPWLDAVRAALHALPVPTKATTIGDPFANALAALVKPASKPLSNSLQLRRDLKQSFSVTGDAGLRVTTASAPEIRAAASSALASSSGGSPAAQLRVYALRVKTGLFGRLFPQEFLGEDKEKEWRISVGDNIFYTEHPDVIHMEGTHSGIAPNQWVVMDFSAINMVGDSAPDYELPGAPLLVTRALDVASKLGRWAYGAPGETTRIRLASDWISPNDEDRLDRERNFQIIRNTQVFAGSEALALAQIPIPEEVCTDPDKTLQFIELDGLYSELEAGRFLLVQGTRKLSEEHGDVPAAEAVMITEVVHDVRNAEHPVPNSQVHALGISEVRTEPLVGDRVHTFVRIDKPLSYCYARDSLVIYGNVVRATHGETRSEILGSGDASKPTQTFQLKQAPLTFLAAPTAVGADSTLQVFVQDVRWQEQASFLDVAADAPVYTTRIDDDQNTQVIFGNGREGARLPTGTGNVTATYRTGIGKAGNARAGQISILGSRPLGVREVINPIRASGGADREGLDQARKLAPLALSALDRLVSTQDYADFARTFAGIAKAEARELSDGQRSVVHVTIAGSDDVPIDETSDLFLNLHKALVTLGDPHQPVRLAARELLLLVVSAEIHILPSYQWEKVAVAIRARLLDRFGFERRELAERVFASEVIATIQAVPGVHYVDLDLFGDIPTTITENMAGIATERPRTPAEISELIAQLKTPGPDALVIAERARLIDGRLAPAQLAILSPDVPETLVLNPAS